jgi:hypothetical protein
MISISDGGWIRLRRQRTIEMVDILVLQYCPFDTFAALGSELQRVRFAFNISTGGHERPDEELHSDLLRRIDEIHTLLNFAFTSGVCGEHLRIPKVRVLQ